MHAQSWVWLSSPCERLLRCTATSVNRIDYLQADYDILRRLPETSRFCDVYWRQLTHLTYISAMEPFINYCIFYNIKFSCSLRTCTQFMFPRVLKHLITLYYITLHYIIPPHCTSCKTNAHLYVCTLANAWLVEEKHHQCKLQWVAAGWMQAMCAP